MSDSSLRVLIVDCAVSIGGTPIVAAHIAKLIQQHGHQALVVTALQPADAESVFPPEIPTRLLRHPVTYDDARQLKLIFRNPSLPIARRARAYLRNQFARTINLKFALQLAAVIEEFDADIVHVNNGIEPHMAAAIARRPSLQQVHGLFPDRGSWFDRALLKLPRHFLCISDIVARSARAWGIEGARLSVVPNFLNQRRVFPDRALARAQLGLPADAPVVALVGRVVSWKGQLEFIQSMRLVADRIRNVQIVIAGDTSDGESSYYESVKSLARQLGLSEQTHFIGHLDEPYMAYRAADVIAHCSLDPEPFGMVLIEAMEAGTPVVAASLGGPLEIIEDGISGFLADPRMPAKFAEPIVNLLSDATLAERIATAARARFERTYSAEAVYPQLLDTYARFVKPASVRA